MTRLFKKIHFAVNRSTVFLLTLNKLFVCAEEKSAANINFSFVLSVMFWAVSVFSDMWQSIKWASIGILWQEIVSNMTNC